MTVTGLTTDTEYEIRIKPDGDKLKVAVVPAAPDVYDYVYIKGSNFSEVKTIAPTSTGSNIFSFEFDVLDSDANGNAWFKLALDNNDFDHKGISSGSNSAYTFNSDGNHGVSLNVYAQDFKPMKAGHWTFSLDLNNQQITYTWQEGRPATPVITHPEGSNTVTISCATEGAVIHYTTDGSDVDADSPVYTAPIVIQRGETLQVQAMAVKNGKESDKTNTYIYSYTPHAPGEPVMSEVVGNKFTLTVDDPDAIIYYTTDGTTTPSASEYVGCGKSPLTVEVPEAGFPNGIRAVAINDDGAGQEHNHTSAIAFTLPVPTIEVATVDGKGVFTITNNYSKGTLVCTSTDGKISESFETSPATITVDATTTLRAHLLVSGVGTSDDATATWTNPADKKPIYYVSYATGWNKGDNNDVPNALPINWNAKENAYVLTLTMTTSGSTNSFKISNSPDVSSWNNFNSYTSGGTTYGTKTATLTAVADKETTADLSSSESNFDVPKIGYWTLKINGDFTKVTYSWRPLNEEVTVAGWTLNNNADWRNKTSRFFYLSREQNDSRVSPEWEFVQKDEGTWTLDNFMVIPAGQFTVREITRSGSGSSASYTVTDWAFGGGGQALTSQAMGIPASGKAAEQAYTLRAGMAPNATRGFFWNIGFTMANLKITRTSGAIENDGRPVIYYKTTSSTAPGLHLFKGDGTNNGTAQMIKADGGYYYYKVTAADQAAGYTTAIFCPSGVGNWNNQSKDQTVDMNTTYVWDGSNLTTGAPSGVTASQTDIYLSADMTKPSTLNVAPHPGMPYVSLMGSLMATTMGDEQIANDPNFHGLDFIAKIKSDGDSNNSADNNTGYTNGFIYHNANGQPMKYGSDVLSNAAKGSGTTTLYYRSDGEDNQKMYADTNDANNSLKAGKAIYSTRQPPVYPIYFSGVSGTQAFQLTSSDARFKYEGTDEVSLKYGESNGVDQKTKTFKVAKYTIHNLPLLGKFKVFSGHGGSKYGATWNGLSMHTNWGFGASSGGSEAYNSTPAVSKLAVPLSGAGPKQYAAAFDGTARGVAVKTSGDSKDFDNEDNTAGCYVAFSDRTYVSTATFYYALETDDFESKDDYHYVNDDAKQYKDRYTNSGRNYSWIEFSFTGNKQEITLDKTGPENGMVSYAINKDGSGDELITLYKVYLYPCDEDGNRTGADVWYEEYKDLTDVKIVPTTTHDEDDLLPGYYRASITTTFDSDEEGERTITTDSRVIRILPVMGAPKITAAQDIHTDKTPVEYTLDVIVSSEVTNFIEQNPDDDGNYQYSKATATLTIPVADNQELVVIDGSDETNVTAGGNFTKSGNAWTFNAPAGYFNENLTTLPTFKVKNTLPGETLTYTIVSTFSGSTSKTATANVTIKAPRARYVGEASFKANWDESGYDGYTSVEIPEGSFELRDPDNTDVAATLATETQKAYTLQFDVDYSDKAGNTRKFTVSRADQTGGNINLDAAAKNLPYYAKADGTPEDAQVYNFDTKLTYVRAIGGSAAVDALAGDVKADNLKLTAPRQGLSDKQSNVQGMSEIVPSSEYNTGGGSDYANDYIRLMANWQEKWGGVNNQVEDALIAAEVTAPAAGTVYRFDAADQKISHHANSIFNPAKHFYSEDAKTGVHEKAPGYGVKTSADFWKLHSALTKEQHMAPDMHPNFVERTGKTFRYNTPTSTYPAQRSDGYNSGVTTVISNPADFNHSVFSFWAGCLTDDGKTYPNVDDDADNHILQIDPYGSMGGGEYNKADGSQGYYGSRNHHFRQGWKGGEYFSRDWFVQAFAKTAANEGTENVSVTALAKDAPFNTAADANAVLAEINGYIASGTGLPLIDAQIVEGKDSKEFGRDIYLKAFNADPAENPMTSATGRVMLKVNHVNHESWYGHSSDVTAQWNDCDVTEQGFTSGKFEKLPFKDKLRWIRIAPKYYTPVAYSFTYEYPVLNTPADATLGDDAATYVEGGKVAKRRTAANIDVDKVTNVMATSTGLIAFDGANDDANDIVTAIESVGADQAGANGCYFRYSREAQTLTAISPAGVGTVNVTTVDGRAVKAADGKGAESFTLSLAGLAEGWYVVTAEGVGSMKLLK
ncbi:MAG: chitobiase/beta-hexosaminidase C-terminal domain-containing protein [Candidatus Amulumruptor caecigallinarius]|nr:chitobiase/beta-hexosaminidase C-terminal domain-containing protein [Candidatus Amulumruptor caecigallinarius]MCM1396798.1 chitobiase/beta-hexosaminidase C-terminal domain-containing protein [Candidatus Amulumruptor caecigallinarius]MCM1454507.1 chitobiase/beta-hexosaminidase C-terminal domain-containing protein [bacterium]